MEAHPRVRTFRARRGRTTPNQRADLDELLIELGLPEGPIEPRALFGRDAPLVLEVGSGLGHAALGFAGAHDDQDLIAVDVHTPGIALLASRVAAAGLTNVRVHEGDVFDVLDRLPTGSLSAVHLFFPDPWPKRNHRKRRFMRADVLDLLADRMRTSARILLATDVHDYAMHSKAALDAHQAFTWEPGARPTWRPLLGFEARADAAGRPIAELVGTRI